MNVTIDTSMRGPEAFGNPMLLEPQRGPVVDGIANYFQGNEDTNHIRGRAAGALLAAGLVLTGTFGLMNGASGNNETAQLASYGAPAEEDGTTPSSEASTTSSTEADNTPIFEQPGVVGEAPCGPKVDLADALARFNNNEVVVKPSETAEFFNQHPEVEQAKSEFYTANYGEEFINWVIDNKEITNPDILKQDGENSVARELMARYEAAVLEEAVEVQNHQCVDGEIVPVNNVTVLQAGEQVWSLQFTQADVDKMAEDEVEIPENAVEINPVDREGVSDAERIRAAIAAERLACNNPLIDREEPPEVPPTQPPTTNPPTTAPPTTTVDEKDDDGELPPCDPDNPNSEGVDPAECDPGTPDDPGEGPAGQEPCDDGFLPQEHDNGECPVEEEEEPESTTTSSTTPATTLPTSTTNPPVTATSTTSTTTPNTVPTPEPTATPTTAATSSTTVRPTTTTAGATSSTSAAVQATTTSSTQR